jgi:hypothetical protein
VLTAQQVHESCRRGDTVFAQVLGKYKQVGAIDQTLSTRERYRVQLWVSLRWVSVDPSTFKIIEKEGRR